MANRGSQRIEARIVDAICKLQALQGSTPREICNYISQEYDVPAADIRRHVRLALERGLTYGILQRLKGGSYAYNQDFLGGFEFSAGDARVDIPCSKRRGRRHGRSRSRKRRRRSRSRKSRRRSRRRRSKRRRSRRRRGRRRRRAEVPKEIDGLELKTLTKQPDTSNSLSRKESLPSEGSSVCGYPLEHESSSKTSSKKNG